MAVAEIHLGHSKVLGKMTSACVIFPEGQPGPFPVFYLLHGLSDDHSAWVRRTSIERYMEGLPFIVVMPNGERSFYVDAKTRMHSGFDSYITNELDGFVSSTFRTMTGRRSRVIAGLSMGGYGALGIALRHPDMFCAAASHSGAVGFASRPFRKNDWWTAEYQPVLGKNPKGGPDDLYALAKKLGPERVPAIRIDCGRKDFLIGENRKYHRYLKRIGIPHEYQEHPGVHNWEYWDLHIRDTIGFFRKVLKV